MEELDKSKFRFKIGDIVLHEGGPSKILAYCFLDGFNNFNHMYGYTLEIPGFENNLEMLDLASHDGSDFSYNESGKKLSFKDKTCWHVCEGSVRKYSHSSIEVG